MLLVPAAIESRILFFIDLKLGGLRPDFLIIEDKISLLIAFYLKGEISGQKL